MSDHSYPVEGTDPETTEFTWMQNTWSVVLSFFWLGVVTTNDRFAVAPAADEDLNAWYTVTWFASQHHMGIVWCTHFEVDYAIAEWVVVVLKGIGGVEFCG